MAGEDANTIAGRQGLPILTIGFQSGLSTDTYGGKTSERLESFPANGIEWRVKCLPTFCVILLFPDCVICGMTLQSTEVGETIHEDDRLCIALAVWSI